MFEFKKISLPIFLVLFLIGCSQKIEGEAFYKEGDKIIPLADIDIRVIELEKFRNHVKKKEADIESEISRINSSIERLEQSNKSLIESKNAVLNAQMKLLSLGASWNINSLGGQYMQNQQNNLFKDGANSMGATDDAVSRNVSSISAYKKEIEALRNGRNGKFLFPVDKNEDSVATKTQSNGKYEITLKSSQDSVLIANNNGRYWLIKIGKDDKRLNLTDSNENGMSCDVCSLK